MTRSELIKFRVTPTVKASLARLADKKDTTVSALLRDQTLRLMDGPTPDPKIRKDLATVRQLANMLLDEAGSVGQVNARRVADLAIQLRTISGRHLTPAT